MGNGITWDIELMTTRVESLNAMVEWKGVHVVSEQVGGAVHARLQSRDGPALPLTFFSDGLKLGNQPFQTYQSCSAQEIVKDVLDGYFPYAMKEEHPDGIRLRVIDRMKETFHAWLRDHSHRDPELIAGGDRLLPAGSHALHLSLVGNPNESFAKRPPDRIIRAGKICENTSPDNDISYHARTNFLRDEISILDPLRDQSSVTVRLQVKFEDGKRVVLLMEPSHTIGRLHDELAQIRSAEGLTPIDRCVFRTAVRSRDYTDPLETLADAGLAPSATLFVSMYSSKG